MVIEFIFYDLPCFTLAIEMFPKFASSAIREITHSAAHDHNKHWYYWQAVQRADLMLTRRLRLAIIIAHASRQLPKFAIEVEDFAHACTALACYGSALASAAAWVRSLKN